ncbi:MAG: von Willebrand factor type A domain-containing protein [Flavisolibacter sp.]|nr:von Willebrand factor type A domain-containing protein [Flavisolibacter sp.]
MKTIAITILLFFCISSYSQQFYLRGEVKDESGKLLQNVAIVHQRTGYLYYSGISGSFGIYNSNKEDTLLFSLDGFQKQKLIVSASRYNSVVLNKGATSAYATYKLASLTKGLQKEIQKNWFTGDESYASTVENQFIKADAFPSTGLALRVDRASYSNIRRFINTGSMVPPDAVRLEEMLNYFNFNYKEPKDDKIFETETVLTNCPWNENNQLLFALIRSKKIPLDSLPPTHLVFLIDVSGSMDMPNRLPLLKAGFAGLLENLRAVDSVSVVVYGGTVGVALKPTSGADKKKIWNVIDSLQPGGSTPGESGIKTAYNLARNHFIEGGNNRVILATDGDFNVGIKGEEELEELILSQRLSGIYLTCLGVGMGNYKDSKIQTLAKKGNGNFAYIDTYAEAEKVLLKEFTQTLYTVADDVYLNVSFDTNQVKEYRLIGFENKVGAIKDLEATIEGGEVGSAFTMLVAFEIVPAKSIYTELKPVVLHIQFKLPNGNQRFETIESPVMVFSPLLKLPATYQFATAVIMFGSILRESKFLNDKPWNQLVSLATHSADMENPSQKEFVQLVEQAKIIYTAKKKKNQKN